MKDSTFSFYFGFGLRLPLPLNLPDPGIPGIVTWFEDNKHKPMGPVEGVG